MLLPCPRQVHGDCGVFTAANIAVVLRSSDWAVNSREQVRGVRGWLCVRLGWFCGSHANPFSMLTPTAQDWMRAEYVTAARASMLRFMLRSKDCRAIEPWQILQEHPSDLCVPLCEVEPPRAQLQRMMAATRRARHEHGTLSRALRAQQRRAQEARKEMERKEAEGVRAAEEAAIRELLQAEDASEPGGEVPGQESDASDGGVSLPDDPMTSLAPVVHLDEAGEFVQHGETIPRGNNRRSTRRHTHRVVTSADFHVEGEGRCMCTHGTAPVASAQRAYNESPPPRTAPNRLPVQMRDVGALQRGCGAEAVKLTIVGSIYKSCSYSRRCWSCGAR